MHAAYESELPDGWTGGLPVTKYWRGDYIKLYRVTRTCASCSSEISIDVTKKALQGKSKNAGLLLRNCPDCRDARRAGGVGSRGGTSRPTVAEPVAKVASAPASDEVKKLKARVEELEMQLGEMDAADSARLDKVHAALIAAGYRVSVDEIAETVRKHIAPASMPWGPK